MLTATQNIILQQRHLYRGGLGHCPVSPVDLLRPEAVEALRDLNRIYVRLNDWLLLEWLVMGTHQLVYYYYF